MILKVTENFVYFDIRKYETLAFLSSLFHFHNKKIHIFFHRKLTVRCDLLHFTNHIYRLDSFFRKQINMVIYLITTNLLSLQPVRSKVDFSEKKKSFKAVKRMSYSGAKN